MKEKELSVEEVLKLEDGTKVILKTDKYEEMQCVKTGHYLKTKEDKQFAISEPLWEMFNRKVWLYEEEKKVKKYTFEEVIARIKEGQTYECTEGIYRIKTISKTGGKISFDFKDKYNPLGISSEARFTLVQQTVTFMEAVEAIKYRKVTARCDYDGMINYYKYLDGDVVDSNGDCISYGEILKGVWTTNES